MLASFSFASPHPVKARMGRVCGEANEIDCATIHLNRALYFAGINSSAPEPEVGARAPFDSCHSVSLSFCLFLGASVLSCTNTLA